MDISNLIKGPVGEQIISSVANQLGINNQQAQSAVATAVPFLLTALSKNAANGDAENIVNALNTKHDGGILDNLSGFLNSGNFSDGIGILGHVLGNRQPQVEQSISKNSGLNVSQVSQILAILAPIVMGYLGKQKNANNLDANGLTSLLGGMLSGVSQTNQKEMSMIEKLLDQNGDGSIMDDAMNIGSKLLGGLFGGKK